MTSCVILTLTEIFKYNAGGEASEYHTLGGLLLKELQHIPTSGETLQWNGFTFEVVDMDGARIDKVLVTTPIAEDNGDEEA
jgi:putative hemolysin